MKKKNVLIFLFLFIAIILSFFAYKFNFLFIFKNLLSSVSSPDYTEDKIHFIKNEENGSDSILIQSNGHCGLVDTMNPATNTSGFGLNTNYDTGKKVKEYAQKNGCTYLDFLIITHNHTDHHGGVGDIKDLINNKTIVFYKTDKMPDNNSAHDVEDSKDWHNHDYYLYNMNIINSKNAITCDVSASNTNSSGKCYLPNIKNNYITSVSENKNPFTGYETNMDYTYYFAFGNYTINLYNLYTLSLNADNYNSIVTLLTHSNGTKTLLTGDIETSRGDIDFSNYNGGNIEYGIINNPTGDCTECTSRGLENQMADIIGKVDILKAAHHGLLSSNSYYALTKYQPSTYVIDNIYDTKIVNNQQIIYSKTDATAGILYMDKRFNTKSYYTNQSSSGLVVQFNSNGYSIKNNNCSNSCSLSSISNINSNHENDRWYRMNYMTNAVRDKKYMYVKSNGDVTTGWGKTKNSDYWYFFDEYGILKEGLVHDSSDNYYYYNVTFSDPNSSYYPSGSVFTNKWKKVDGYWYYFRQAENEISTGKKDSAIKGWGEIKNRDDDAKNWYYFNEEAKMQKELIKIDNDYYYFRNQEETIDNVKYPEGSMFTGWKKIEGVWYYFRKSTNDISEGSKGSAIKGWGEIKNRDNDIKNWYYFNEEAKMQKGLINVGGNYYYSRTKAELLNNITYPEGSMYKNGLKTIGGYTYYFRTFKDEYSTGPLGSAIKNECIEVNGVTYCFDEEGKTSDNQINISNLDIRNEDIVFMGRNSTPSSIGELLGISSGFVVSRNNTILSSSDKLITNDILNINNIDYTISVAGDVLADGIINIQDAAKTYKALKPNHDYSTFTQAEIEAIDANQDGKKNGEDIIRICRLIGE